MLRCSEIVRLTSSDEYLTAGILRKLQIRLHLAMCEHCSRYVRQLRALTAVVRNAAEEASTSEVQTAKSRILQQVSKK